MSELDNGTCFICRKPAEVEAAQGNRPDSDATSNPDSFPSPWTAITLFWTPGTAQERALSPQNDALELISRIRARSAIRVTKQQLELMPPRDESTGTTP